MCIIHLPHNIISESVDSIIYKDSAYTPIRIALTEITLEHGSYKPFQAHNQV